MSTLLVSELSILVLSSMVAAAYPQTVTTGKGEAPAQKAPLLPGKPKTTQSW